MSGYLAQHDASADAEGRVRAMQDFLSDVVGSDVRWEDAGETAFEEDTESRALHALRSLAAFHEYPPRMFFMKRAFKLLEDPRDHPSLRRIYQGDDTAYPHLMRHSDNRGFWFPAEYSEPYVSNEPQWWCIGSVVGLERELERLGPLIAGLGEGPDRTFLEESRGFFLRAASAACAASLPLIIEG